MQNSGNEDERDYLIARLLDDFNNLWIGEEFVSPIHSILERLPISALQELAEKAPVFLVPDRLFLGRVICFSRALEAGKLLVYFSPELLTRSREEVEFTIAHELAHVVLGHKEEPSDNAAADAASGEREADDLAQSWGFLRPPTFKLSFFLSCCHFNFSSSLRMNAATQVGRLSDWVNGD